MLHATVLILPGFILARMLFTGSVQRDVLEQKDPTVPNFLPSSYCPGIVRLDGSAPLTVLDTLIKGRGPDGRGGWRQFADDRERGGDSPRL